VDQRLSWMTSILPYLDIRPNQPPPYEAPARDLDPDQPWNAGPNAPITRTLLARYLCPAWENPPLNAPAGETSYVGLAGVGLDAPSLPFESYNAGFFGYDRATTSADLLLKGGGSDDAGNGPSGSSYIIVAMETCQANGPWGEAGPSTCRGLPADLDHPIGLNAPFGGLHPGGANALRADGAVHFEGEGIEPQLLQALVRLRGQKPQ
jgi:prepilin-type processing-associated H-X9-DG protein